MGSRFSSPRMMRDPGANASSGKVNSRSISSFISLLPTELLCNIFMLCGRSDDEFYYPREDMDYCGRSRNLPWLHSQEVVSLGLVCARWFAITRGCPQLWTMVDVSSPRPCDIAALRRCIRYSSDLPLTLRINDRHNLVPGQPDVDACQRFMQIVASVSFRWDEISILSTRSEPTLLDLVAPLLFQPTNAFRRLRRAMIKHHNHLKEPAVDCLLWQMFFASPSLRQAQWAGAHVHAPASTLVKLTHVGVNDLPPQNILDLVRSCPKIEVLQISVRSNESVFPGKEDGHLIPCVSPRVVLPHLRVIMLSCFGDWTNFFESISTPSLSRLDFAYTGIQATAIDTMLQSSHARLDMLSLRYIYDGHDVQCAALLRCASLRQLRIVLQEK
ncbi:uncharacterized protein SCHCODRAFT_02527472, partial [Schizophyllum commune H4-8]|uniref:uncharacterized protein n=1 Tax=Schizophyllum commune (strain H4-8 / FGSC 9210) TaxID=578458 RepID=UPI0021610632